MIGNLVSLHTKFMHDHIAYVCTGLLGMVPPGTMLANQMQPNLTVMAPPKPEDTIVVCVIWLSIVDINVLFYFCCTE